MFIEWDKEILTGNEKIDGQHREMFQRIDAFLTACNEGKGRAEVSRLLGFVGEYVRQHFDTEEELQRRHHYPEYTAHKEEHDGFVRSLRNLEKLLVAEGATLPLVIQTNQTLVHWLVDHINGTDKKLAAFLRTQS